MVDRTALREVFLGRSVAVAFAVLAGLYLARQLRLQPLQIPAYLLIVAYDAIEAALPAVAPYHAVGFPVFLYLLAVVSAGVARRLTPSTAAGKGLLRGLVAVCLTIGVLSLLLAAVIGGQLIAPADNPTPLVILSVTGAVFLLAGWWLLRRAPSPLAT
jgi:hypothetical protein